VAAFHELAGDAPDLQAEADRYQRLLAERPPVLVALGIGENGHLAFIDPGECDFDDPRDVRIVNLDDACREQQVHDGAFARVEDVPRRALSLTIPFFMRTPHAVVTVPGPAKARAVRDAIEGPIAGCPASILRNHPGAAIFLDADSAALLNAPEMPMRDLFLRACVALGIAVALVTETPEPVSSAAARSADRGLAGDSGAAACALRAADAKLRGSLSARWKRQSRWPAPRSSPELSPSPPG
jgi:hypothetical protein